MLRKGLWTTALSFAAILGLTELAFADGYDRPGGKGFVAPAYDWSGVYMGVHGGYAWGDSEITEIPLQILGIIPPSFTGSNDIEGGLGGVHLGMNKQFNHWVIGGEFRLSGADISGATSDCAGLTSVVGIPGISFNCDTSVNWLATALAKVGYAENRWLVYGTAGWAVAGVDYKSSIAIFPPFLTLPSGQNDTADGFAFGGGIEYAVADSVSLGVDYTRMDLSADGSGVFLGGILSSGSRDIELNTVTARLNIKWGG